MVKKQYAMRCLKCGKVLALLGELSKDVFAIDEDTKNRYKREDDQAYIVCKFCGAKNALVRNDKPGLPSERLSHIIE